MNAPRNTQYRYLETHRIAGSLGAEISGVDLSEDLPDDVLAEVRAALLDNCVIFFRNQSLTPEQQLRFARRWGEIHLHPFMQGMADYPEILEIIKTPEDKKTSAARGTPTRCSRRPRRWARSYMRWKCRRPAAIRCSPTSTSHMKACQTA